MTSPRDFPHIPNATEPSEALPPNPGPPLEPKPDPLVVHAGMMTGVVVGGIIGSIVPGLGTIIGAGVGGLIGHYSRDAKLMTPKDK
jgi:hypothetical protein